RHASGGHPPPLLLKDSGGGEAVGARLPAPRLIVGGVGNVGYAPHSCSIPPGATPLGPFGGWYEIRDPHGPLMEISDFEKFMQEHGTLPDGLDRLLSWVRERHGDGPLDDDFTIVRIQFQE